MKPACTCSVAALLFSLLIAFPAAAQQPIPAGPGSDRSSLFLEIGGNGILYSINFESRFHDHLSARLGFSFFNVTVYDETQRMDDQVGVALIPLMLNVLVGRGSNHLEVGAGPLLGMAGSDVPRVDRGSASIEMDGVGVVGITSAIGYRYQRPRGGLMLRAALTPFHSGETQLWGGVSLGLSH